METKSTVWACLVTVLHILHQSSCSKITHTYQPIPPSELRNLARNVVTGELYIGAINNIYKLDGELVFKKSLSTGPRDDNLQCPPNPQESCCGSPNDQTCSIFRKPSNATSIAMVIDKGNDRLIACSTLYYGSCSKIRLASLEVTEHVYNPVVSNDPNLPPVVFIGQGVDSEGNLYVASPRSHIGMDEYTHRVPLLATRSLNNFEFTRPSSFIDLRALPNYEYFEVLYKFGFEYKKYNYFLSVQRESITSKLLETRISRVCQLDEKYHSYIELTVECTHGISNYNVLQSAYIEKPGSNLARALGLMTSDDLLFGVFTRDGSSEASAVCSFPMVNIERLFQQVLGSCLNGDTDTAAIGPEHLANTGWCSRLVGDA